MPDRLVWAILLTRDIESAMRLYREAVGWRFEEYPTPQFPCWVARWGGDEPIAVMVDASGSDFPDAPELWLPHFTVGDLDHCIEAAEAQGATVLRDPFDIPGFGRIVVLRQPAGAIVAWRNPPAS